MTESPRYSGQISPVGDGQKGRRKLTDWVYEELKAAILDLRLRPGEPLREAAIAERLGTSKTPVREALAWLERDGLVETEVFKGAVVSGYSRRDLMEIYELRELLEVAAARDAANDMDDGARDKLKLLSEETSRALGQRQRKRLSHLISEFDSVLFDNLENRRMRALIANLRDHLVRIGRMTEAIPGRLEVSVKEHDKIVQAILRRDPDTAAEQMRAHILSVRADQLERLDDLPTDTATTL